ncbi:hypothetical protein TSUD_178660 [Trifolium subterraneum]|uniref:Uncharacterized protein n=1 Tax=Trifolium subterraneum TaxID=3900 RepID=A0A2Z6P3X8_TRISU|nr:hypothetical protein TSUD_178660 [Trifolium subterraneum]
MGGKVKLGHPNVGACNPREKGKRIVNNMTLRFKNMIDFAVVIFPYSFDLGRDKMLDDTKSLLPFGCMVELENERESGRNRKAPSFDVEDNGELSASSTLHLQKSLHF